MGDRIYLIPIKIRAPLIFAHLACPKIKGSKLAKYESAKIKGNATLSRVQPYISRKLAL